MSRSTFVRLIVALLAIWVVFTLVDAAYTGWQEAHPSQLVAPTPTPKTSSDGPGQRPWPPTDSPYLAAALSDGEQQQIAALTLAWQVWQESSFHPNVHAHPTGAMGTRQVLPATAHGLGIDSTDPTEAQVVAALPPVVLPHLWRALAEELARWQAGGDPEQPPTRRTRWERAGDGALCDAAQTLW